MEDSYSTGKKSGEKISEFYFVSLHSTQIHQSQQFFFAQKWKITSQKWLNEKFGRIWILKFVKLDISCQMSNDFLQKFQNMSFRFYVKPTLKHL